VVVGVCRIVLALPGVDSLKGKRSIVRRIVDRVRHKFNAAIAEVAEMDAHRRAVLGFAVVSNDARHANSMVDTIVAYVAGATEAMVIDRSMELVHLDAHFGSGLDAAVDRSYDDEEDDGR
jgi:uncharacterized protein YlxP (DUF503 family)